MAQFSSAIFYDSPEEEGNARGSITSSDTRGQSRRGRLRTSGGQRGRGGGGRGGGGTRILSKREIQVEGEDSLEEAEEKEA